MASEIKCFRDLMVWQQAHEVVLDIYRVIGAFPDHERYGLVSQMRRAAYSNAANIVEGFGRRTTKEFLPCLNVSKGSLEEIRYCAILSFDLRYLNKEAQDRLEQRCDRVGQLLGALKRSLVARARDTEHETRNTT